MTARLRKPLVARVWPQLAELPARHRRLLAILSVAALFGQYDRALFALALPQIQASLGIDERHIGILASVVRLGALPAFVMALAADRVGRRRALLTSILCYTVATGATALSTGATGFVALQFVAATFSQAALLLAVVVLAEELDAEHRAGGIGVLFAVQASGVGLAALLLPLVNASADGWRVLFGVGLAPLLLVALWWQRLPETRRFEQSAERTRGGGPLAPLRSLLRAYPGRLALVGTLVALGGAGGAAADFLGPKYLQQELGWAPVDLSVLYLAGGLLGILGPITAGRLSDGGGRRPAAIAFSAAMPVCALVFYHSSGWLAISAWVPLIFALLGFEALLAAYGSELFPTSYRATAAGARQVVATVAASLGLACESWLYDVCGSHWTAVSILIALCFAVPIVIAVAAPETSGRRLEEISPERDESRPAGGGSHVSRHSHPDR